VTPDGPQPPGDEAGAAPREAARPARVSRKRRSPPPERVPREQRPIPEPMSRRNVVIFAVFIGVLYAVGMVGRGEVAAGLVGGVLCSVLAYLVFTEVGNRQRRRIAAHERRRSPEA
jgi:hypothetical protein